MSKAILVMDMPKTCYECRLSNRLNPDELILCDGKIVSDTSTIFNLRPGWCPLREIPKRLNSNNLIATAKENNLLMTLLMKWNGLKEKRLAGTLV